MGTEQRRTSLASISLTLTSRRSSGKVRQRLILRIAGSGGVCPGWQLCKPVWAVCAAKRPFHTNTGTRGAVRDWVSRGRSPVPIHLCPCAREVGSGGGQATHGLPRIRITCHPSSGPASREGFWRHRRSQVRGNHREDIYLSHCRPHCSLASHIGGVLVRGAVAIF